MKIENVKTINQIRKDISETVKEFWNIQFRAKTGKDYSVDPAFDNTQFKILGTWMKDNAITFPVVENMMKLFFNQYDNLWYTKDNVNNGYVKYSLSHFVMLIKEKTYQEEYLKVYGESFDLANRKEIKRKREKQEKKNS